MGFKLVIPKQRANSLQRGEASLNAAGLLTFNKIDLVSVNFVANACDKAALLVDTETRRIAIRVAVDKEPFAKLRYNKGNTAATIGVAAALKELGVKTIKPKRYEVTVKDNLLFIVL
jgi:hypothetical protein